MYCHLYLSLDPGMLWDHNHALELYEILNWDLMLKILIFLTFEDQFSMLKYLFLIYNVTIRCNFDQGPGTFYDEIMHL